MRSHFLLLGALAVSACTYTVRLTTVPAHALVTLPSQEEVRTPTEIDIRWRPGARMPLRIEAPGYQPITIDLTRTEGGVMRATESKVWMKGMREVEVLLTPLAAPLGAAVE